MYATVRLVSYGDNNAVVEHSVTINGYHVSIADAHNKAVFSRSPERIDWADETHKAIFTAIEALERALKAAIPK